MWWLKKLAESIHSDFKTWRARFKQKFHHLTDKNVGNTACQELLDDFWRVSVELLVSNIPVKTHKHLNVTENVFLISQFNGTTEALAKKE